MMKTISRIFAFILCFCLAVTSLAACGAGTKTPLSSLGGGTNGEIQEDDRYISSKSDIGDIVTFGRYEQDADLNNGKEPIEWIVLDKNGDSLLLLSKYILDYCEWAGSSTIEKYEKWDTSGLRSWMNGTFLNTAFSPEERKAIQYTPIETPANEFFETAAAFDTVDRVFAMSMEEYNRYKEMSADVSTSNTTLYAFGRGVRYSMYDPWYGKPLEGTSTHRAMVDEEWVRNKWQPDLSYNWDLRSPGFSDSFAMSACGEYLYAANTDSARPAIWVNTSAIADVDMGEVPSSFYFGSFDQDGYMGNGKEPVEWIVLETREDRALALCKYGLYVRTEYAYITCTPFEFFDDIDNDLERLYNEFLFTDQEKEWILDTDGRGPLFLLTEEEAECYFESPDARKAGITEGAAQMAEKDDFLSLGRTDNYFWWLQARETAECRPAVDRVGNVTVDVTNYDACAVRPAMWISLDFEPTQPTDSFNPEPVALLDAGQGDRVLFGSYEQHIFDAPETEKIEWLVLERNGNELFLLSTQCLDCFDVPDGYIVHNAVPTTWEESDMRRWLNDSFYGQAFSEAEKAQIELSSVENNIYYTHTDAEYDAILADGDGRVTQDYVFLLNLEEIMRFLPEPKQRVCAPSQHAVANGAKLGKHGYSDPWMSRSATESPLTWMGFGEDGDFGSDDAGIGNIRPAIKVRIS